jgi:hypothetical protein
LYAADNIKTIGLQPRKHLARLLAEGCQLGRGARHAFFGLPQAKIKLACLAAQPTNYSFLPINSCLQGFQLGLVIRLSPPRLIDFGFELGEPALDSDFVAERPDFTPKSLDFAIALSNLPLQATVRLARNFENAAGRLLNALVKIRIKIRSRDQDELTIVAGIRLRRDHARIRDGLGNEPVGAIAPLSVFLAPLLQMPVRRRHDFYGLGLGVFCPCVSHGTVPSR